MIKCNPAKTDLTPMVAAGRAKSSWCVADNYRTRLMAPGQRVLLWVSAHPKRGVWGTGQIVGDPVFAHGSLEITTSIPLLREPLTGAELRRVPGLESMEVFRAPQQSNPSWVSVHEWAVLAPLLSAAG